MRGLLLPLTVGALACFAFLSPPAMAVEGIIIDWGLDCYGWETDYAGHISAQGSQMTIVGKIHTFYDPFLDLDPAAYEYTFRFTGLTSLGTIDYGGYIYETSYAGGTFEIFVDSVGNFDFGTNPPNPTSPSTFIDGTKILEGTLENFFVQLVWGPVGYAGSFTADFVFTGPIGGEIYHRVEECFGSMLGDWSDDPNVIPTIPEGYDHHTDGKFDLNECTPTGTEPTTWGTVKELFR